MNKGPSEGALLDHALRGLGPRVAWPSRLLLDVVVHELAAWRAKDALLVGLGVVAVVAAVCKTLHLFTCIWSESTPLRLFTGIRGPTGALRGAWQGPLNLQGVAEELWGGCFGLPVGSDLVVICVGNVQGPAEDMR